MITPMLARQLSGENHKLAAHEKPAEANSGVHRIAAVVIGAGPIAIAAASQLHGVEYCHQKSVCKVSCHQDIAEGHRITEGKVVKTDELGRRGVFLCGNWFDRFFYKETGEPEICAQWRTNLSRKVETLLIGNSAPGGSWSHYHPEQLTVSPYHWMGLPELSIERWADSRSEVLTSPNNRKRSKISAHSLCDYYSDFVNCSDFIPSGSIKLQHNVTKLTQLENKEWHLRYTDTESGAETEVQCRYVVLACGRTKARNHGAKGEGDSPIVTHTSAGARTRLATLPAGSKVLLMGKGMSAADIFTQARLNKHHVTHLIPQQHYPTINRSSSHVLEKLDIRPNEFVDQIRACKLFKGEIEESEFYTRKQGWDISSFERDGCVLFDLDKTLHKENYDLVCLAIGSEPDLSLLGLPKNEEEKLLAGLNEKTMESNYQNLFLIGTCTGEPFQRFALGQAAFAVETIKAREGL